MNFGERIKTLLKIRGITRSQLAVKLDISITRINHYINNRYEPSFELLIKIAMVLDTTVDFLLGRIHFYPSNKNENDLSTLRKGDNYDLSGFDNWQLTIMIYGTKGEAGSGPLSSATHNYGGYALFKGGYFLLVEDDSMAPYLNINDLAGIEPLTIDAATVTEDKFYVIAADGDNVARLIRKASIDEDRIIFSALNPNYPPVSFPLSENRYDLIKGHVNVLNRGYE